MVLEICAVDQDRYKNVKTFYVEKLVSYPFVVMNNKICLNKDIGASIAIQIFANNKKTDQLPLKMTTKMNDSINMESTIASQ